MKRTLILLLCLVVFSAHALKNGSHGKQYRLTGRVIGELNLQSSCGVLITGTVVEFEVIKLEGISYHNNTIGIIVTCPELYGAAFFEKDKTYEVVFTNKYQTGFASLVPNRSLLNKDNLSFEPYLTSIKKVQ